MASKNSASKQKDVVKPVSTIVKKRSWIVPVVIVLAILVVAVLVYAFMQNQPTGTVLATVNGEPIYQEEIDSQFNQLPEQYRAQYTKDFVLNQTIDKLLLIQEAKKRGITATEADVDTQIQTLLDQFGIGKPDLEKILLAQNVSYEKYRQYVREDLIVNKVVQDAVSSRVSVTESEVMDYYESHAAEFTAPNGGAAVSHILVENQSLSEEIIAKLVSGDSFDELAQQYSLDTTAQDGGYLGIITQDTPLVPEFKDAALKLKENTFTKKPVQTQYGYHVIMRRSDKEPLKQVRQQIEKSIKLQKQVDLFESFLSTLRSQATIKYYTEQGVVSQKQVTTGLDAFAICVSEKATLYGTSWSEFVKEQQNMFGTSFGKLTYVDCEEKPHLCSAAKITKYPTWIVAGDDQEYGKLTLKELSEKTGCALSQ